MQSIGTRWSFLAAPLLLLGCQKDEPREQRPELGIFCVEPAQWNAFLDAMRDFGIAHGLELHGGIETDADGKPSFNAYLARGYSFWRGDDLDLWVTSNPFVERRMTLSGISKTPWTFSDYLLANELLAKTAPLRCVDLKKPWVSWQS